MHDDEYLTVKSLIEELQKQNPEAIILTHDQEIGFMKCTEIKKLFVNEMLDISDEPFEGASPAILID